MGEGFFYALTSIQITLVLLAAPAVMAGAFGAERERGRLVHLFVTDLTDTEVVLGTLAGRLAPIWGWIACGVPVMALAVLLGGIDPGALAGACLVSMVLVVLICALTLAVSIRLTRLHEVLMVVYGIEAIYLMALPLWEILPGVGTPPAWSWKMHPYVMAFGPYIEPGWLHAVDFAGFAAVALGLAFLLTGWTIFRLRAVTIAGTGHGAAAGPRTLAVAAPATGLPLVDGSDA